MEKQKIDFANVALYVDPKSIDQSTSFGTPYGVWKLYFVDISEGLDNIKNWDRYSYTGKRVRHLCFRAQWERNDKARGVYGYSLQLDVQDSIERVEDAQALVDIMKRIEKSREKFFVTPNTFGQYVALMCAGLGVKKFVYPTEEKDSGWGYSKHYHLSDKVGESLVRFIDWKVEDTYFPEEKQKTA